MFRPRILLASLLIVTILISAGAIYLLKHGEKKELVTLKVWEGKKSILYLPLYVALQEGYFTEQGIKVKLVNGTGTTNNDPYVDNSVSDIILTDYVDCLYHKSVNPESPVIIASTANRDNTFLLAREKNNFSWEEMQSKNIISYPPETGPGFVMEKTLREHDLVPMRNLCLYNRIPNDLRLGAFKSGSGSYIQLTGLEAIKAEENNVGYIVASLGKEANVFPSALCAVWPDVINKHPDALQGFVNAIYKAQLWMQHEPELGLKAAKKNLDIDKKLRNKIMQKYTDLNMWEPIISVEAATFSDNEKMLEITGQLVVPVAYESAVNNTFAEQATKIIKYIPKEEREKSWFKKIIS